MSKPPETQLPKPLIDSLEYLHNYNLVQCPDFAPYDLSTSVDFLKQYSGNKHTFDAYRREIERLLQWAWLITEKSLLDLKRQDMENYIQFCLSPPKSWIGFKKTPRFITEEGERKVNQEWRPFIATVSKAEHKQGHTPDKRNYQLSQKAVREIFTVLSSFYNYLALEGKIENNPITLIKQKSKYLQKRQQQSPIMRLSQKQLETCLDVVRNLADSNPEKHERTLFILSMLYLMYLRISELVANNRWIPQMRHFYQDAQGNWWFKTVGKGNKSREIAVADDMLAALQRYRKNMLLSSLPSINDKTPLLPKEKGKGPMTSSRHIRKLVQDCFDQAICKLRETGFTVQADSFESATVHWLRHTGISDDINKRNRPIAHVRDDAGHSSSAITDRYNDIELHERHLSAKNKKISKRISSK